MAINTDLKFAGGDRVQWEFECVEKYLTGIGIDVGCGTNRLSKDILAIDRNYEKKYADCEIVHDCKDLDINAGFHWNGKYYSFKDCSFDFIFSSHVLEDFTDIPQVFRNWWRKLKPNGLMLLLLPDMENGRYPKVGEPTGNPAHRTNVGNDYIRRLLKDLNFKHEFVQCDTLPHDKTCTIDFVIKKL